ncbi:hypothetical protein FE257_009852 [Aspergillus nanangensis]|uniref:PH domain-containing protein n=1 Tax=Aspergillus nanangensis TaxID=2582783 RepID=A0AAD4GXC7_ASPNN|nr:hypothetical protein FE257_009852 [Aspergillus nanangensis]
MSFNIPPRQPSVSERRGQHVAPLNTNFSRPTAHTIVAPSRPPRPYRPRPEEYQNEGEGGERVPLHVKPQSSKSGLRSLFGRDKAPRKPDPKLPHINEAKGPAMQPGIRSGSAAPPSPVTCTTPKTIVSTSTMLASPTAESTRTIAPPSRQNTQPLEDRSAGSEWKPPALFQAYPQAIKHDCLSAPAMSADSILRVHGSSTGKGSSRDEEKVDTAEDLAARMKKEEKEKSKHMRSLSETMGKTEWTKKVYILATSGYILQYAGSGKHDRLPEKMLQLGPRSVAFASDAIPGKHWVLQVSQSREEHGAAVNDAHRSRFSRFGFHRSHARRMARSFLLVFNTPEDLSSWLLAVRAQIEACGGKKYVSEKVYDEEMEHELHSKPSTRRLVKRDPNRFSQVFLQPQHTGASADQDPSIKEESVRSSPVSPNPHLTNMQPTPEPRSASASTIRTEMTSTSTGQGRFYSSGAPQKTPSSPQDGSAISAVLTALEIPESPRITSPKKRQSMLLPKSSTAPELSDKPRSHSAVPDPLLRSASPPAPNFSVPSFSRRFAAKPPAPVPAHQAHVPNISQDVVYTNLNGISAFPSPPQSPVRSVDGFGWNEAYEQHQNFPGTSRRRSLRVSNSEASLIDPGRSQEKRMHRLSRMPAKMDGIQPNAPEARPRSIVTEALVEEYFVPLPPQVPADGADRREALQRMSVLRPVDSAEGRLPAAVSRRKSMPGLAVGPPVAPPPNCPLPKLPSPIDPPPTSPPDPSFLNQPSCTSPPPTNSRASRKSVISAFPRPSLAPMPPGANPRRSRVVT